MTNNKLTTFTSVQVQTMLYDVESYSAILPCIPTTVTAQTLLHHIVDAPCLWRSFCGDSKYKTASLSSQRVVHIQHYLQHTNSNLWCHPVCN